MIEKVIYKLLDKTSFNLKLNEALPKFTLISEILSHNSIPFQTWNPKDNLSMEVIEMNFSANCKFQDIYLFAFLLRDFGIESIYPSTKQESEISIGTYLHQVTDMEKYALAEPMDIDTFLNIDPKLTTQNVIDLYFENDFTNVNSDNDYQNNYDDRNEDYGRYTFDALTDGQYGNYDDWREGGGDFDSLRDRLGY